MIVQINTDKNIEGSEKMGDTFSDLIKDELGHFSEHITRVEAHFADENGKKSGPDDIRCTLEARIEGRQPIAVTSHADTPYQAVSGATDKLRASLDTIFGKMKSH